MIMYRALYVYRAQRKYAIPTYSRAILEVVVVPVIACLCIIVGFCSASRPIYCASGHMYYMIRLDMAGLEAS